MTRNRTTLKAPVQISGLGLFSAQQSTLTLCPSRDSSGIFFVHQGTRIPAHIDSLSSIPVHHAFAHLSPRCTSLHTDTINIATTEHLLSALVGLGITDARIEIQADRPHTEIPIMDGSALDFVEAIEAVGLESLDTPIDPITVSKPIIIEHDGASITIEPASSPSYSYTLQYDHPAISNACVSWFADPAHYIKDIAPARTFCLEHEADKMHSAGLFTHLSTKDMLVIGENGPIDNTLRHPHECAAHKLLDLIGDLSLVGKPLLAKVSAFRSGHAMAHRAAAAIVEQNRK